MSRLERNTRVLQRSWLLSLVLLLVFAEYAFATVIVTVKKPGSAQKIAQTFPSELGLTLADVSEYFGIKNGVLYDERGDLAITILTTLVPSGSYTLTKKSDGPPEFGYLDKPPNPAPSSVRSPKEQSFRPYDDDYPQKRWKDSEKRGEEPSWRRFDEGDDRRRTSDKESERRRDREVDKRDWEEEQQRLQNEERQRSYEEERTLKRLAEEVALARKQQIREKKSEERMQRLANFLEQERLLVEEDMKEKMMEDSKLHEELNSRIKDLEENLKNSILPAADIAVTNKGRSCPNLVNDCMDVCSGKVQFCGCVDGTPQIECVTKSDASSLTLPFNLLLTLITLVAVIETSLMQ